MNKNKYTRKISVIALLIAIMSTLTGCVKSTIELKFNNDGSGEYYVTVGIDEEKMKEEIEAGKELGVTSAKDLLDEYIVSDEHLYYENMIITDDDSEYNSIKAYFKFDDLGDMQTKLNDTYGVFARYEGDSRGEPRSNILDGISTTEEFLKYTVHLNIPKEDITAEKYGKIIPSGESKIEFRLTVPDRARVLKNNSDYTDGNTYVWEIKDEMNNIKLDFEMDMMLGDTEAKVFVIYIPAVISVLFGLVMGVYWWKKDKALAEEYDEEENDDDNKG